MILVIDVGNTNITFGVYEGKKPVSYTHLPQMLPDGQQIRQHLCGMEFIGQAVPYRNPCILCQLFHNILPETAVFDSFCLLYTSRCV